ncbi:Mesocentin [Orchesella cincta]|uniref:Mesocentin n=1 Tax=Orchesella cincta TaxID=48709 RepID=A0A1D2M9I9_ORCCI|nr:Mesocentin [Orchesella cincta]
MSETNLKTGSTASISSPKRQSNSSEQNEKELFSPKRTSDERPQMPPLGPDGKPLQPPIGPDGRPLYPPLGLDGKPLPPPKLGPDGKPLPPPIIGPDGNELPRPTDKDGRPMPVYITKDGKAVLDEEGKPIALKFDAEGKPVPLYPPTSQDSVNGGDPGPGGNAGNGMAAAQGKLKDNIPGFLLWMGLIDLVLSLFITGLEGYLLSELASDRTAKEDKAFYCLMTAVILSALGVIFAIVLIFSVKQSKSLGVYVGGGPPLYFLGGNAHNIGHVSPLGDNR